MIFANLTVLENLQIGAYLVRDKKIIRRELEYVFTMFPRLKEREQQIAGTLSGGEQQMLAIGRALMSTAEVSDARRAVARPRAVAGQNDF